ncbi:MAG: hypothetical protein JOY71_08440 [Acetobacteraceae bacterium]|nr:hypothetical protein [Acetobacteraceae bacterium]
MQNPAQTHDPAGEVAKNRLDQPKPGLKARAIDEGKKFAIMTAYLWVLFAVFNLHKTVVLQQRGINFEEQGFAIVNALILAKVMLIADDLKLGTRFTNRPLIYHVLYSSFAFAVVLICFQIAEGAIRAWLHGKPLAEALSDFGAGNLRGVLSLGAIVFVSLIPFFTFRAIGREIGEDQLWQMVFTRGKKRFTLVVQE